jgi:hypothetical protein
VWLRRRMGVLGKVSSADLPVMRRLVHYYKTTIVLSVTTWFTTLQHANSTHYTLLLQEVEHVLACIKQGRPLSTCLNVYRRDGSLVWLQVLALAPEREREPARSPLLPLHLPQQGGLMLLQNVCAWRLSLLLSPSLFPLSLHSLSTLLTRILSLCLSPHPLSVLTPSPLRRCVWNTRK